MIGIFRALILCTSSLTLLASCGKRSDFAEENATDQVQPVNADPLQEQDDTIWSLFANVDDPNVTVAVNRYLWYAALEILDFLPIESADPFSGVIDFGYGIPPGGGGASYRATVYVSDPALDARSLRVALSARGGPVSRETTRQIEDAILTRARQLRIRESGL